MLKRVVVLGTLVGVAAVAAKRYWDSLSPEQKQGVRDTVVAAKDDLATKLAEAKAEAARLKTELGAAKDEAVTKLKSDMSIMEALAQKGTDVTPEDVAAAMEGASPMLKSVLEQVLSKLQANSTEDGHSGDKPAGAGAKSGPTNKPGTTNPAGSPA
jgi:hypothetical protein